MTFTHICLWLAFQFCPRFWLVISRHTFLWPYNVLDNSRVRYFPHCVLFCPFEINFVLCLESAFFEYVWLSVYYTFACIWIIFSMRWVSFFNFIWLWPRSCLGFSISTKTAGWLLGICHRFSWVWTLLPDWSKLCFFFIYAILAHNLKTFWKFNFNKISING